MMDPHTLSLAGFVSQITFALTLTLLAWSDPRTRGMAWLAGGAGVQLLLTTVRTIWPKHPDVQGGISGALLVLLYFLIYLGLRWFAVRRNLRTWSGPATVLCVVLLSLALAPVSPVWAVAAGRFGALGVLVVTARMLWGTRLLALRVPLRVCAGLSLITGGVLMWRQCLDCVGSAAGGQAEDLARLASIVVLSLLLLSFLALFVAETNRRLHDETRIDVLTGLRNRRAMEEAAAREVRLAVAGGSPMALLMMDLDHFKKLNDNWGHGLGDRALRAMGSVLLTAISEGAVTARMGGEEFAVLLPGYDLKHAATLAERVRASVEDLRLAEGEQLARFTVSVGVAALGVGELTWTDMMVRADDALYRAKHEGRNRVAVCTAPESGTHPCRESKRTKWHLLMPKQGPML